MVNTIRELSYPLGLFGGGKSEKRGIEPELIGLLIELRDALREKKEFELADMIRTRLGELGVTLKDTPQGTLWT